MFGFSACFVPVDLCYGWGVVFLSAVCFVDPFLLLLLFVSFRLFSLLLCFFALPFVCKSLVGCRGGLHLAHGVTEFVVSLRGIVYISHETSVFWLVYECWQTVLCFWLLEPFCSGFGETSLLVYR